MASLSQISLAQFRNYSTFRLAIHRKLVAITGPNGVGKTNLMDAIYLLCYTKSYFTRQQNVLVQQGFEGYRVEGHWQKNDQTIQVACVWKQGKKELWKNGVAYEKLSEHIGLLSAVMIAPDDISLINESSDERRKWMDGLLCQYDKTYLDYLWTYQKILLQRNALLKTFYKNKEGNAMLDYYDGQLAQTGDYIFKQRHKLLQVLLPQVQKYYALLAQDQEQISWHYESDVNGSNMHQVLKAALEADLRQERSTRGIHRDEVDLLMNKMPVKNYASQGQKKSLLFALKLAQYFFLQKVTGNTPVLLLDDVFEKLDEHRLQALMKIILAPEVGQVFITDTNKQRIKQLFEGHEIQMVDF